VQVDPREPAHLVLILRERVAQLGRDDLVGRPQAEGVVQVAMPISYPLDIVREAEVVQAPHRAWLETYGRADLAEFRGLVKERYLDVGELVERDASCESAVGVKGRSRRNELKDPLGVLLFTHLERRQCLSQGSRSAWAELECYRQAW